MPLNAGVHEQEVRLQRHPAFGAHRHRLGAHGTVGRTADTHQPATGADVLILDADAFPQQVLFHVHGLRRQPCLRHHLAFEGIESVQQAYRER